MASGSIQPSTGGGGGVVLGGKENCSSSSAASFRALIMSMGGLSIHSSTVGGPGIRSSGHSNGCDLVVTTGGRGMGVLRGAIGGYGTGGTGLGFFGGFGLAS